MTRDERIEAAAEALCGEFWNVIPWERCSDAAKNVYRRAADAALDAAYPDLSAGTHWIAPREMTESMAAAGTIAMTLDIERRSGPLPPDTPENAFSRGLIVGGCSRSSIEVSAAWSAARDAYLKEGEKP